MLAMERNVGRPPMNRAVMKHCGISKGLDVLVADYKRQDFHRHSHSEYVIGLIESGSHDVWCRGGWWHARRNAIATLSPDEPHFGGAGSDLGWSQTMFYIPESSVRDVFDDDDKIVRNGIAFRDPFGESSAVAAKLVELRNSLGSGNDELHVEELFQDMLRVVFGVFGSIALTDVRSCSRAVYLAQEFLHDTHDQRISLDQLCEISSSSKQAIIAEFKHRFGMTPFQYLQTVRVMKARDMLRKGHSLAEVAASTGFSDQSHLSRSFRSILGVTPGCYSSALS